MAVVYPPQSKPDLPALAVLAVLSERECHPYEISRVIRTRNPEESFSRNGRALYHAVDRLAEAGLIESVEVSREGRRPERTMYRITAEGREELRYSISDLLSNPRLGQAAFAAGVARLAYLSEAEAVLALEVRLSGLEGLVARHQTTYRGLRDRTRLPRLFLLEMDYLIAQLQAETAWVAATVEAVRQGDLAVDGVWLTQMTGNQPDCGDVPPERVPLALRDWSQPAGQPGPTSRSDMATRQMSRETQEESHA
ncbi:MAG TPA: PadR family transcriptional regulator [Candidatus Nanopelagicaceae bacterium]|nr:PadR family transcriptional regulator [Candidatus Nanopelagicaceae bacterium]